MAFHVGQKVVCVDDGEQTILKLGAVYVVDGIDEPFLAIRGAVGADGICNKWFRSRFRPIVERKTDISIFQRMLTEKRESVDV